MNRRRNYNNHNAFHKPYRRRSRRGAVIFYLLFTLFGLGGLYFGYVFIYYLSFFVGGSPQGLTGGGMPVPPGPFVAQEFSATWAGEDRLNILLLGLDQRDGTEDYPSRSDTMIVLTVDPVNKTAGMLSIPRDLWVPIPGVGENKINTAHFFGEQEKKGYGPSLAKQTVEYNFGIPIHYYAKVNFRGFEKLVDAIDGIDIDVLYPVLDDEYPLGGDEDGSKRLFVPAGWQHMDGRTALEYARSRHGGNDFRRSQRQQEVLVAAKSRALRVEMLPKLPGMLGILNDSVTTDIPSTSMLAIAQLARSIPSENITSAAIDYSMVTDVHGDGTVLSPKREEIGELIAEMFAQPVPSDLPGQEQNVTETARIEVLNGTDRTGFAAVTSSFLKEKGFVVVRFDNADSEDYEETLILDHAGKPQAAKMIGRLLGAPNAEVISDETVTDDVDITIILGADAQVSGYD